MTRPPKTVAALMLCWLGGCTSKAATPGVTVTDSAGVTIVESSAPAWGDEARWTLDSIRFFTLSGSGPEYRDLVRGLPAPDGTTTTSSGSRC